MFLNEKHPNKYLGKNVPGAGTEVLLLVGMVVSLFADNFVKFDLFAAFNYVIISYDD